MYQRTNIRQGMTVMSRDGVQIGRVVDVTAAGIIIEKGQFFFIRDFEVPLSDISTVQGDEIILLRDHAELRRAGQDAEKLEGTAKGTVGVAGIAAPPPGEGLGLGPTDLTEARMDSAKFQDHGRYHLQPTHPIPHTPHEPPLVERRAAGPGWDPLSVDEELEKEAPRTSGPDPKAPTRY